jgi:hypothetical protein
MNPFQNRIISPTLRFVHHALRIIFLFQQSVFIRVHPWFKLFLLMFFPGSFCISVMAAPITFQSSETQTSLLELYTSEGCSSCPPAESWLSRLKESPGLWKDFVPVAFHVDYWNYLGWRDPWSTKAFTDRQHAYARTWRSDSVYTLASCSTAKNGAPGLAPNQSPCPPLSPASSKSLQLISRTGT